MKSGTQYPWPEIPLDVTLAVPRFLPKEDVGRIAQHIISSSRGGGDTSVAVVSWWTGGLRWARNRASLSSDRRDIEVRVQRDINGVIGGCITNQLDDVSLAAAVRAAERGIEFKTERGIPTYRVTPPLLSTPKTQIWSDTTYNLPTEERGVLADAITDDSEKQSLLSAGYLEMLVGQSARQSTASAVPEEIHYHSYTQARCSITVRHPKGIGSGWAGVTSYDWNAIDSHLLAKRALDKCLTSLNPVAIEPGRYTVILEPQAVYGMLQPLMGALSRRLIAEDGKGPFALDFDGSLKLWRTKLGLRIVDERITIRHDPADPLLGIVPWEGLQPVTWIQNGVLTNVSYDRKYALRSLSENLGVDYRSSFTMSGGTTSIDEMIATTTRGLLVTRFSHMEPLDSQSLLVAGLTRDGLWLIENQKISKAVKNLRFTESPLFVLNQIEQLGFPVPVFSPERLGVSPVIVPPIKARDFSFTSTIDAI